MIKPAAAMELIEQVAPGPYDHRVEGEWFRLAPSVDALRRRGIEVG